MSTRGPTSRLCAASSRSSRTLSSCSRSAQVSISCKCARRRPYVALRAHRAAPVQRPPSSQTVPACGARTAPVGDDPRYSHDQRRPTARRWVRRPSGGGVSGTAESAEHACVSYGVWTVMPRGAVLRCLHETSRWEGEKANIMSGGRRRRGQSLCAPKCFRPALKMAEIPDR